MSHLTSDPITPLVEALLRSNEPDRLLAELCERHPEHAGALRAYMAGLSGTVAPALDAGTSDSEDLERIGPYELLDVLGEGGMGTVYLAEQREPLRRRVALKLIKLGKDSRHPREADGRPRTVNDAVAGHGQVAVLLHRCLRADAGGGGEGERAAASVRHGPG